MALQKLPNEIQSLICATTQICNYKRAVEELVYNSLDAEATSIAIRVNIEENTIQVIDNGCGVSRNDYSLLGERHATSKCVDLSNLKSAPNKYGFRGQSLASIIEVSKCVKLTSRCQNSEEALVKSFYKGKVQEVCEISQRSSKGMSVDIKGFLYCLKIQKKTINPVTEINDIKKFLEQLSLVHNNISLSLRDGARNEIVIKLHKNRDIYQTLSSVFEINKEDLQELMVEKNQYKVTAYIGKKDKEINEKHCLYLNGKFLQDSKLHTVINDHLKKALKLNLQTNRKIKSKNTYNEEDDVHKSGIPCYFIFIKCPYHDYDVNYTLKKTVIEFKDWEQINKMLEKLAKFYVGDIVLNKTKTTTNHVKNIAKEQNTRDEVKRIIEKILGTNTKKVGVSQMQKGIKGKIIKRKPKKQTKNNCLGKIMPDNTNKAGLEVGNNSKEQSNCIVNEQKKEIKTIRTASEKDKIALKKPSKTKKKGVKSEKCLRIKTNCIKPLKTGEKINKACNQKVTNKTVKTQQLRDKRNKTNETCNLIVQKKKNTIFKKNTLRQKPKLDYVLKKFNDPTDSVKKRCNVLANKVDDMISYKTKRKRKVFINETVQYSNVVKNNKNYSVHKRIGEIVIHDYIPKPLKLNPCSFDNRIWENLKKNPHKSSYDLVQTILRTQETRNICTEEVDVSKNISPTVPDLECIPKSRTYKQLDDTPVIRHLPKLTFDSHNYEGNNNSSSHNYDIENQENQRKKLCKRFITTQSRNNFIESRSKQVNRWKKIKPKFLRNRDFKKNFLENYDMNLNNSEESSYNIEFSKSNEKNADHLSDKPIPNTLLTNENENRIYAIGQSYSINNSLVSRIGSTYNINSSPSNNMNFNNIHSKEDKDDEIIQGVNENFDTVPYCVNSTNNTSKDIECIKDAKHGKEHNRNFIFISKSSEIKVDDVEHEVPVSQHRDIDPLTVCETICSLDELEETHGDCKLINDSRFRDDFDVDSLLCDRNIYTQRNFANFIDVNGSSFHLSANIDQNLKPNETNPILSEIKPVELDKLTQTAIFENLRITNKPYSDENKRDLKRFNLKNRLRFVPKGMSPIFENCQTKYINENCDGKNYYEETIYNNFTDNVRVNTKIFEPEVQNLKNLTTAAVEKFNSKLTKDNASLVFNGETLKHAQVLGQIDNKFIAAKVTGKQHKSHEFSEYLVLFDQHAVHERIRLEDNLSDYFNGEQWKKIALDEIPIKLPKDVIIYLHNYKDKFGQLGLEWTVLDHSSVSITAIPEAILGKNPRQADMVMKAVKNLIVEEINVIKTQSGCITLYPKSIMDLVFSEACRYAIKFGDRLSLNECVNLLNSLAECKTPFQCAHGRPVMAVLMEMKSEIRKYKVNLSKLCLWSQRKKR